MALRLKTQTGYFADTFVVDGSELKYRELDDEALTAYHASLGQARVLLQELSGISMDNAGLDELAEVNQKLQFVTGEQFVSVRQVTEAVYDSVIVPGLVGWDLEEPCNEDNKKALPNWVKLALAKRIVGDSFLTERDRSFLAR